MAKEKTATMQIGNIVEGMQLPNYRKLCDLLGEPYKDGTSKTAQLNRWKRYFSYERQGNAFVITEVYDTPKINDDQRMLYSSYIEHLLLQYLSLMSCERDGCEIEHSIKEWCIFLGLASAQVFDERTASEYVDGSNFSPFAFRRIVFEIVSKTRSALLSTLNRLKKDGVLDFLTKTYIVTQTRRIEATANECTEISQIKTEAMRAASAKNMYSVHMNKAKKKAYNEAFSRIMLERHGWDSIYISLVVLPRNFNLIQKYKGVDAEELRKKLKKQIQRSIREKLAHEQKSSEEKQDEYWDNIDAPNATAPFYLSKMMGNEMEFLLEELL